MFKRTSKLTALLVAAATVVSTGVSASAAERLGSKEGNITSAYSYAEGKYVFDGYITDDDDSALYYNDGSENAEVEDYDDYDYGTNDTAKYGAKYVTVKDGDDTYLLDLETGKISDDESVEDKSSNLASKLKTTLKKADRYEGTKSENEDPTLIRTLGNKYGEVWYKYSAYGDSDATDATAVEADDTGYGKYLGFVNADGDYIDVSSVANIYAYSDIKGKTVKFEKYGEDEDFGQPEDADSQTQASVKLEDIRAIDQDEDYIYAIAKVKVVVGGEEGDTQYFFQKISKEQGDKEDGAYVPKSVASYQIDKADTTGDIYSNGDMKDAYDAIVSAFEFADADAEVDTLDSFASAADGDVLNVNVKNSVIYVTTKEDSDTVKMFELKFKKDKVDTQDGHSNVDAYVVEKDADADEDVINSTNANPVSIDTDGETWILGKGKVFKYEDGDFAEKFTCDRSINNLDVYDSENLVAWDSEGDIFTVLQGGEEAKDDTTTDDTTTDDTTTDDTTTDDTTTTTDKAGWDKNEDGSWSYYTAGAAVKGQWVQDGNWYYINEDGKMATGWLLNGENWYYLNASGAMVTGWFQDVDGNWYYLNASGAMAANTTVDGYVLGANGAWVR